jgi:phosphoenolpyruvate carboxylase
VSSARRATAVAAAGDIPAPLRREVRLLSTLLGRVIAESGGAELLADVERLRRATIAFRGVPNERRRDAVVAMVEGLDLDRAERVARAFAVYFQLVNLAEEHHRIRALRERAHRGEPISHSLAETIARFGSADLETALDGLRITAVLTAHPTEARRRSVVETLRRIAAQLERLDEARPTPDERSDIERRLCEEITALWNTDQLRRHKPEPLDEVRAAMWLFDESIFALVPRFYRELDRALSPDDVGTRPPPFRPFLSWGSWIGGDRDGNPSVNADVTREALSIHEDHVLRGLEGAARRIARELSATAHEVPPSDALVASLDADARILPALAAELERKLPDAPHRRKLTLAAERLRSTRLGLPAAYAAASAFRDDLNVVQQSLYRAGAPRLAYGELQGLAWQAETFGFHLASLEIRQHAEISGAAAVELFGSAARDPVALDRAAATARPGTAATPGRVQAASASTVELVATLRVMAELQRRHGRDACRRFVVSFTRAAADVLAVRAVAALTVPDGSLEIDVVPLFESRADLEAAPRVLDDLIALPGFSRWLESRGRHMEVMLGYSDSAKDVGPLAANLVLYRAQRELAAWGRRNAVELTLFHGRGGALGRGGGPAGRAILGQAPGSVEGRLKVTEQGEVTVERYGSVRIAQRHLEQITSAVLAVSMPGTAGDDRRFDEPARRMADASERAWRALVERPGFAEFFARVTPYTEIRDMAIGSRPARRSEGADLSSLRAIPWVFAWSQSRCNLTGWYGIGAGLAAIAEEPGGLAQLRNMLRDWPHFASVMDNAQLSLAKTDPDIAALYLALGDDPGARAYIEEEFERTVELVLAVTGQDHLLQPRVVLRRAIELRNAYVDALSFLQLRFLRELRSIPADGDRGRRLRRLVQLTVNGVAAGLQNTG